MFRAVVIAFSLLFINVTSTHGQSYPMCDWIGKPGMATFKDTYTPGQPRYNWMQPLSNCPIESITVGGYCHVYKTLGGWNSAGWGTCTRPTNVFTRECFDEDICFATTYAKNGMCVAEASAADYSQAIYTAIDCNNMQTQWKDTYGGTWAFNQAMKSQFINGTINTNTAYAPGAKCGTWSFSGTLLGNGSINLTATNQTLPAPSTCLKSFTYAGITAGVQSFGSWKNNKSTGQFILYRQGRLAGTTQAFYPINPVSTGGKAGWQN